MKFNKWYLILVLVAVTVVLLGGGTMASYSQTDTINQSIKTENFTLSVSGEGVTNTTLPGVLLSPNTIKEQKVNIQTYSVDMSAHIKVSVNYTYKGLLPDGFDVKLKYNDQNGKIVEYDNYNQGSSDITVVYTWDTKENENLQQYKDFYAEVSLIVDMVQN